MPGPTSVSFSNLLDNLPIPSRHDGFWSLRNSQALEQQIFAALGFSVSVLLILFITMANAVLLKALWWKRRRAFTPAALVSMGCADMAQCVFAIPLIGLTSLQVTVAFEGCLLVVCAVVAWSFVSSFHHLLIAIHRWCAVVFPTRYHSMFTFRCISLQFAFCWSFGLAVAAMPLAGYNNLSGLKSSKNITSSSASPAASCQESTECSVPCSIEVTLALDYIVYVLFYICVLLPLIIISVFYILIFKKVRCTVSGRGTPGGNEIFYLKQKNMANTMALQVALVALTRFPFYLVNMIKLYCPHCSIPSLVVQLATICIILSASCNPFIYIFRDRKMKTAIRHAIGRNRVDTV